jgi:UPF0755 protein
VKYLFLSLLLIIFVTFSLAFWYLQVLKPINSSTTQITFTISKDEAGNSVISRLYAQKLIRSELASKIYQRFVISGKHFKPGAFQLSADLSTPQIFQILISGPKDLRVTIPEGWRREQIAERLKNSLPEFNTKEFLAQTQNLEGRLFPDTYLLPVQSTTAQIIKIFTDNFDRQTQLDAENPLTNQIIILASLIEREAKDDTDRRLVSGILIKRLENDWPLQVDATVQYAVNISPNWWAPITDTKYPSPYNTYLHTGIPPKPICNPGLASISAAQNPQNSSYWYYLSGTDGITRYATDLAGHNLNVDKYLRP